MNTIEQQPDISARYWLAAAQVAALLTSPDMKPTEVPQPSWKGIVCSETRLDGSQKPGCFGTYHESTFALVNLSNLPRDAVSELAEQTEKGLEALTNHIVDATVVVIEAPGEVTQELFDSRPCINTKDPQQLAATFAFNRMPELERYDHILGITEISSCDPSADGVATVGGRMGDVLDVSRLYRLYGTDYLNIIATHEGGHQLGLHHDSVLVNPKTTVSEMAAVSGNFDLERFLSGSIYYEYNMSPANVMGNPKIYGFRESGPSPIQLQRIMYYNSVGYDASQMPARVITSEEKKFSPQDIFQHHRYGTIELAQATRLPRSNLTPHKFDELAIVPVASNDEINKTTSVEKVDLYLTRQSGTHQALLGTLMSPKAGQPQKRTISYKDQNIEVNFDGTDMTLRLL